MTNSPGKAGVAGFFATLPYVLCYLPAGVLLDQYDRRKVMLVCEVGRFVALGSIPLAAWLGRLSFAHVLVVSFVAGTFFVFFSVAERSIVPSIVSGARLPEALARQEARSRAAGLAGPPLGGFLYGLSHAVPFVFDALSYVVSFVTTLFIRADLTVKRERPAGNLAREVRDGIAWLVREPFIRATVALVGVINIVFQAFTLTLIVLAGHLGASSAMTGLVLGCYGVGGLAGALVAPWLGRRLSPRSAAIGASWTWAILLLPLALVPPVPVLCPLVATISFVGPLWNVIVVGYQYRVIPDHLLARIKSVVLLVSWGTIPLGSLLAGYLLDWTGPSRTVLVLVAVMTLVAASATASSGIRNAVPAD